MDFLQSGNGDMRQTGLLATNDSLFVSDFVSGEIYQISLAAPEPGTFAVAALGLMLNAGVRLRGRGSK